MKFEPELFTEFEKCPYCGAKNSVKVFCNRSNGGYLSYKVICEKCLMSAGCTATAKTAKIKFINRINQLRETQKDIQNWSFHKRMESCVCPVCNSTDSIDALSKKNNGHDIFVLKCNNCNYVSISFGLVSYLQGHLKQIIVQKQKHVYEYINTIVDMQEYTIHSKKNAEPVKHDTAPIQISAIKPKETTAEPVKHETAPVKTSAKKHKENIVAIQTPFNFMLKSVTNKKGVITQNNGFFKALLHRIYLAVKDDIFASVFADKGMRAQIIQLYTNKTHNRLMVEDVNTLMEMSPETIKSLMLSSKTI